jgi:hypothetical protein
MRCMTISLLQRIAGEELPITIKGSKGVDSVQILALAGHVIAEVAPPVRTPLGWVSQSAVVREITGLGRRMASVNSRAALVTRNERLRPRGPLVIALLTASLVTAAVGIELVLHWLS